MDVHTAIRTLERATTADLAAAVLRLPAGHALAVPLAALLADALRRDAEAADAATGDWDPRAAGPAALDDEATPRAASPSTRPAAPVGG